MENRVGLFPDNRKPPYGGTTSLSSC